MRNLQFGKASKAVLQLRSAAKHLNTFIWAVPLSFAQTAFYKLVCGVNIGANVAKKLRFHSRGTTTWATTW